MALARHLGRTVPAAASWTGTLQLISLISAERKIERAASVVLDAERVSRR